MKTSKGLFLASVLAVSILAGTGKSLAWTPGTYPAGSYGFTVDAASRNDVVAFWNAVYKASEGYKDNHGWTGNYTSVSPYDSGVGKMSDAFVIHTERRINFFRALCGVPANVRLNTADATVLIGETDAFKPATSTLKRDAAQRAAYMMARTYGYFGYTPATGWRLVPGVSGGSSWDGMSHTPVEAKCVAWTSAAWNANHSGNIAIGYYGPGAIDAYAIEEVGQGAGTSDWNSGVGHRRWILHPEATNMATGDTPGLYSSVADDTRIYQATNNLYVLPKPAERVAVPSKFVSYPPAGYFPAALNGRFWSLSYKDAYFGGATVRMTDASGVDVPVTVVSTSGSYGEAAIVWQVPTSASVKSVAQDTTFHVTVEGISGPGVPSSRSYSVTLIDPTRVTSDLSLFGPGVPSTAGATYQITPPDNVDAVEVNSSQQVTTAWTEGAEDSPTPNVTSFTTGTYAFRSTAGLPGYSPLVPLAGAKSFRLTLPTSYDIRYGGVPDQWFEIDRELLPAANAKLTFKYRRGYMTSATNLAIESSTDGGRSWSQLGDLITGQADGTPDQVIKDGSRDLTASNVPVRIRFRLFSSPGASAYYDDLFSTYPTGIFIDTITTTGCPWLQLMKTNLLATGATAFTLHASTAGITPAQGAALWLRMRVKLGGVWMAYGPVKNITFATGTQTSQPTFSPAAGQQAAGSAISINGPAGSTIYYRVNKGTLLSGPTPITGLSVPAYPTTLSIDAYASKSGVPDSVLASASYIAPMPPAATPVITPAAGEYPSGQGVTITGETGSTIVYRINGGVEKSAASPVTSATDSALVVPTYPDSLSVSAHSTIEGKTQSATATANYTAAGRTTAPVFNKATGTYPAGTAITMTGEAGAVIHYQINGPDTPWQEAPSPASGLLVPAYPAQMNVIAYASKTGKSNSVPVSATYSAPQPATAIPVFNLPAGSYPAGTAITITADSGATVFYRVNGGTEVSALSPVSGLAVPAYPGSISISAFARKTGFVDSGTATITYTSAGATSAPVFSPASGTYPVGTPITVSGEAGSTIYYRINGGAQQSVLSPLTGITVLAYPAVLNISAFSRKSGKEDSATVQASFSAPAGTTFAGWISGYFPGISDSLVVGPMADPDRDGNANLLEFALGGNPTLGGSRPVSQPMLRKEGSTTTPLMTILVRTGTPAFSGTPSPSASVEGITYTVLGGATPSETSGAILVVNPAVTTGLPTPPTGYEYRTFRLDPAQGAVLRGFMRVRVTASP